MQSIWRATKCKIPVCRRTQIHKNGRFGGRSRTIKNKRTYLYTSIGASLIFILTAVWYMEGSFYPGPLPIGIVAGIVLLIQIALLILCIRNILTFRFHWIIALTMNNPVSVSLLSGDRKPQIRFLGNHHSGSGNLYHKSFRM